MKDFPRLRSLEYILNSPTSHPEAKTKALLKRGEGASHLVLMDLNFNDLLFYQQQKQRWGTPERLDPINTLMDLSFDLAEAGKSCQDGIWTFINALDISQRWTELKKFSVGMMGLRHCFVRIEVLSGLG